MEIYSYRNKMAWLITRLLFYDVMLLFSPFYRSDFVVFLCTMRAIHCGPTIPPQTSCFHRGWLTSVNHAAKFKWLSILSACSPTQFDHSLAIPSP